MYTIELGNCQAIAEDSADSDSTPPELDTIEPVSEDNFEINQHIEIDICGSTNTFVADKLLPLAE